MVDSKKLWRGYFTAATEKLAEDLDEKIMAAARIPVEFFDHGKPTSLPVIKAGVGEFFKSHGEMEHPTPWPDFRDENLTMEKIMEAKRRLGLRPDQTSRDAIKEALYLKEYKKP